MHKGDVDAVDTKPLETIFDRSPNTGCRVIADTSLGEGEKGKYSLFFAVFEALSSLPTFVERTDSFCSLL